MLSEDTTDCLALANTAILMRLIDELIERGAVARSTTVFEDAVCDLQGCPERSARVGPRSRRSPRSPRSGSPSPARPPESLKRT